MQSKHTAICPRLNTGASPSRIMLPTTAQKLEESLVVHENFTRHLISLPTQGNTNWLRKCRLHIKKPNPWRPKPQDSRESLSTLQTHTTGQPLKFCVHVYNWSSVCEGIIAYMVVMHKIRLCVRESVCMCLFVSMFTFVCNLMFHLH